jgi:hypothetical protein
VSVFVSYRRDDAAGYAGRLCDDLAEHVGEDAVFRDFHSIAPGADFVEEIRRAVTSAGTFLAVIGPRWATMPNEHGAPRLSEPDDVVRMEIAVALRAGKPVIPVLVGGASMPTERELPDEIAQLARRNAVEVRDSSWDDDTAKLLRVLDAQPRTRTSTVTAGRGRRTLLAGFVLVAIAATGVGVFLLDDDPQRSTSQAVATSSVGTSTPTTSFAEPFAVPTTSRTVLGGTGDGLIATVDAASLAPEPDGINAKVAMRFENRGPYDTFLAPTDVQLVADGTAINPAQVLGLGVQARTVESMTFDFLLAADPAELIVRVRSAGELAEVPLTGPRASPLVAPNVVRSLDPADVGSLSFEFGAPTVETYSDRHLVGMPMHIVNNGEYDADLSDRYFRLLIDGDPKAPVDVVSELIPAAASVDTTVWWEVPDGTSSLMLRIDRGGATVDRPITQPS